jgi:3-oxoacyl-[acyl-carrier-protein] synthase II
MPQRVAITGIGTVTPLGVGLKTLWRRLLAGECGFGPVESFDTSAYHVHIGAEVKGFRAEDHVARLDWSVLGRTSQFAIAAARLALDDAGPVFDDCGTGRVGVCLGTTSGEPCYVEQFNDRCMTGALNEVGPEFATRYPCHVLAANVAAELGLGGVNTVLPAACAAGNYALAHACELLRLGRAEVMLAGGADSFSRITYTGFARLGAIAPELCQPFDRNRRGMIPGEGAAVLVLECLDRARARGARVYAEIAGHGLSCDAHHMTSMPSDAGGAVRAMQQALADADLKPEQVSYISAHGTGTPTNDRLETLALKRVFGETAYRIPISSIKSMIGHTMGAAAAIEAAVCALAIRHDRVPPTMHLDNPDPECDLDYVANSPRAHRVEVALNNAYGFGGNNSSLVLRKCED